MRTVWELYTLDLAAPAPLERAERLGRDRPDPGRRDLYPRRAVFAGLWHPGHRLGPDRRADRARRTVAGDQTARRPERVRERRSRKRRKLRRLLLVNTALDVFYVGGGLILALTLGAQDPGWRGHGWGIVAQGVVSLFLRPAPRPERSGGRAARHGGALSGPARARGVCLSRAPQAPDAGETSARRPPGPRLPRHARRNACPGPGAWRHRAGRRTGRCCPALAPTSTRCPSGASRTGWPSWRTS